MNRSYESELYKLRFVPKEFEFLNDGHCIVQDEHDDFYFCNIPDDYLQKIPFDSIKAHFNIGDNARTSFYSYGKRFDIRDKDESYEIKIGNASPLTFEIKETITIRIKKKRENSEEDDYDEEYEEEYTNREYNYFLLLNGVDFIQVTDSQLYNTNGYIVYGRALDNAITIYSKRNNTAINVNNARAYEYENGYYSCHNNTIYDLDGTELINGVWGIEFSLFRNGIILKKECQSEEKRYYQLCDGVFKPLSKNNVNSI